MLRQLTPQEARKYTEDDPVRPHLSTEFRTTQLREMWGLFEDKYAEYDEPRVEPRAVVCVAYTSCVVASEQELAAHPGDQVATFYTVWSYDRGAGRQIVNQLAQHTLNTKPQVLLLIWLEYSILETVQHLDELPTAAKCLTTQGWC